MVEHDWSARKYRKRINAFLNVLVGNFQRRTGKTYVYKSFERSGRVGGIVREVRPWYLHNKKVFVFSFDHKDMSRLMIDAWLYDDDLSVPTKAALKRLESSHNNFCPQEQVAVDIHEK